MRKSYIRLVPFVFSYNIMTTFDKLVDIFRQFPGIGPRQAKRFVFFLLSRDPSFLNEFTELISVLKREILQCKSCFRFFQKRSGETVCSICGDPNRTTSELMLVVKDTDLEAMEKSGMYFGKYFVLGGTIALFEKKNAPAFRVKELEARVAKDAKAGALKEVILALSANPDGEHTGEELKRTLSQYSIKISTLGRGLSTGSELEYADKETITSALKNRG